MSEHDTTDTAGPACSDDPQYDFAGAEDIGDAAEGDDHPAEDAAADSGGQLIPSDDTSRSTTEWVPTDWLVLHPDNANAMSKQAMAKLKRNIERNGGHYPPIIVRSLERSERFADLHAEGKLQVVDGEHRLKYCIDQGHAEVEVRIWRGVTDSQAGALLLTLNRLQGRDDKRMRQELIRRMHEEVEDVESLSLLLPDDPKKLAAMLEADIDDHLSQANEAQRSQAELKIQPLTIMVTPEQERSIREAIDKYLQRHDPDELIHICREGAALAGVADNPSQKKKTLRAFALAALSEEYLSAESAA